MSPLSRVPRPDGAELLDVEVHHLAGLVALETHDGLRCRSATVGEPAESPAAKQRFPFLESQRAAAGRAQLRGPHDGWLV